MIEFIEDLQHQAEKREAMVNDTVKFINGVKSMTCLVNDVKPFLDNTNEEKQMIFEQLILSYQKELKQRFPEECFVSTGFVPECASLILAVLDSCDILKTYAISVKFSFGIRVYNQKTIVVFVTFGKGYSLKPGCLIFDKESSNA